MPDSAQSGTPCETADCKGREECYVSCEGEGAYPYCRDCADLLIRHGESDNGPVDDPVVSERDRYRKVLERIASVPTDTTELSADFKLRATVRCAQEALNA